MSLRVRFAPSPTGFLHLGSLRTAFFTYLIARSGEGKFILRIEDTDQKREVKGAAESLIKTLDWAGIKFDEGPHLGGKYGPYIQTQRLEIYKKYVDELLAKGGAYRCFCSSERLEKMRQDQIAQKLPPRYDRFCRDLSKEEIKKKIDAKEPFIIRQKIPLEGEVVVYDELRGEIKFKAADLDDHVLIKSNNIPTYQFASVVDDYLMKISHVTRAEEWLPSFPKNILLYQAFGWTPPKFVHLPVILNKEGGKLSKRRGDVMVEDYQLKGYLPEALINFCALLGWHPKEDNEILSLEEIIKKFNIKDLSASPAIFDSNKLDYFNGYYLRKKSLDELLILCLPYFINSGLVKELGKEEFEICQTGKRVNLSYLKGIVSLEQERIRNLSEIVERARLFLIKDLEYEPGLLIWKKITKDEVKENLKNILELLEVVPEKRWSALEVKNIVVSYLQNNNFSAGNYLWPMRVALTGLKASPDVFDVTGVLGKEETLKRIKKAIEIF